MQLRDALEMVAAQRGERVVITTMSSVATWPELSDTPLDFAYLPSSMGQAPAIGLGLALAQPERGVIVLNGDGSMLMNLGCLVTIAQHRVPVHLLVLDNALYEVTGGQPTVGAGRVDYAGLARAAGFEHVHSCASLDAWRSTAATVFKQSVPTFTWLRIEGRLGMKTPKAPRPMQEQINRLQVALGVTI